MHHAFRGPSAETGLFLYRFVDRCVLRPTREIRYSSLTSLPEGIFSDTPNLQNL